MALLKDFPQVPLQLPERRVLKRMGYNVHLSKMSGRQEQQINSTMAEAFVICRPHGRYAIFDILRNDGQELAFSDAVLESRSLCQLLSASSKVVLLAGTVGAEVGAEASRLIAEGQGSAGLIYDAVGSEVADSVLDWLEEYLARELPRSGGRLCAHRFSAGYGDLALSVQRDMHRLLRLEELGITLTPGCLLQPEKSVTAISGIEYV